MPVDVQQSIPAAQLQAHLREEAAQHAEIIAARPFTLFVRHSGAAWGDGRIIPDEPPGGDLRSPLAALHAAGHERGSRCRITFIAEFAPDLAPAARAAGLVEEGPKELLACTPGTLRPPPTVASLTMVTLSSASSLDEIRAAVEA